jgi:hypothetical protein
MTALPKEQKERKQGGKGEREKGERGKVERYYDENMDISVMMCVLLLIFFLDEDTTSNRHVALPCLARQEPSSLGYPGSDPL